MRSLNVARHRRGPCRPAPSAEMFRAPGATIADKAAVGLLLALATLWRFEREYSLDETGLRTEITAQSLALAANLAPEHRFLMFLRQTGETPEARLRAVQSFPARHLSSAQGRPAAFRPPSGGADPGRPDRVFAGAAGAAYLALRRLRHGPWVALSATLLAFASFYSALRRHDLHRDRRPLRDLADRVWPGPVRARRALAALAGQGGDALLLPFVVLGLAREVRRECDAFLGTLRGSPYLQLAWRRRCFAPRRWPSTWPTSTSR